MYRYGISVMSKILFPASMLHMITKIKPISNTEIAQWDAKNPFKFGRGVKNKEFLTKFVCIRSWFYY